MILIAIVYILLLSYLLLFIIYSIGWNVQKQFLPDKGYEPQTKISIIIAARNESDNIMKCLDALICQNYPVRLFEIIVVDDHSSDNTAALVKNIKAENLKLISLVDFVNKQDAIVSFKKKALATGIAQSAGKLIVTTDADCWMDVNWLRCIAEFYEKKSPEMIVAPVRFSNNNSFLQLFQSLDFMMMQAITAATVRLNLGIMCNGANLAFSRKAFDKVKGYEGVDHLISGDDYLLQSKIKTEFPEGIMYLKSKLAIVNTRPQPDWTGFFNQRIRWASKTGKYKDPIMTLVLTFIYFFNLFLFIIFVATLYSKFYFLTFAVSLFLKIVIEIVFLFKASVFFDSSKNLLYFAFLQPFHIIYIILAGFLSRLGTFSWKQRTVKQN